jgi:hypothetical protein
LYNRNPQLNEVTSIEEERGPDGKPAFTVFGVLFDKYCRAAKYYARSIKRNGAHVADAKCIQEVLAGPAWTASNVPSTIDCKTFRWHLIRHRLDSGSDGWMVRATGYG